MSQSNSRKTATSAIGKWQIKETLGKGGFGIVKLGVHSETGVQAAIKVIDLVQKSSMDQVDIQNEAETLLTLFQNRDFHPHIIRLMDIIPQIEYVPPTGSSYKAMVMVLELARGGELFNFLMTANAFGETVARTYFHQLIEGLEYMHKKKIAHRDLKPENLLLDEKFNLKIADFGFSKVIAKDKQMYTQCGTVSYMAPEIFGDSGYDGTLTDIWSCGIILFIMLAGFPPLETPSTDDWWFKQLARKKHHKFWKAHCRQAYFSDEAKDFINKVLNPDPRERLTIEDMKKHPWYKGETSSHKDLMRKMGSVFRKIQEQKQDSGEDDVSQYQGKVSVTRSGGDEEDPDLPGRAPTFRVYLAGKQDKKTSNTVTVDDLLGDNLSESKSDSPPPVYKPEEHVRSYTQFESETSAGELFSQVTSVLKDKKYKAQSVSVDKEAWQATGVLSTRHGPVEVDVHIYSQKGRDRSLVQFHRAGGNWGAFATLYKSMLNDLSDAVYRPKSD